MDTIIDRTPEVVSADPTAAVGRRRFMCLICGYVYDEQNGDPTAGIAPGTRWENLPEGWLCPECGAPKSEFEEVSEA